MLECNIKIIQGSTFKREFTVTDPVTKLPLDGLIGAEVEAILHDNQHNVLATFDGGTTAEKVLIGMALETVDTLTPTESFNHHFFVSAKIGPDTYPIAKGEVKIEAK